MLAYTSNGSAAPIQRWPKTIAPSTMITNQASAHTRSTGSVVRSGCTSSNQPNPNRPTAAGHTPILRGSRNKPCSGLMRATAHSPPCRVRRGLTARQNWPRSTEIGTRPTHIQTNTNPKIGLVSKS